MALFVIGCGLVFLEWFGIIAVITQLPGVGLVRMDSGFFAKEILDYLEMKGLHYIIACRFNNRIKYKIGRASCRERV